MAGDKKKEKKGKKEKKEKEKGKKDKKGAKEDPPPAAAAPPAEKIEVPPDLLNGLTIEQAFAEKIEECHMLVDGKLERKTDVLAREEEKLKKLMVSIKANCEEIERATQEDMGQILKRLKNEESRKLAVVKTEMNNIREDRNRIEAFRKEVGVLRPTQEDKAKFLLAHRELRNRGLAISTKPAKTELFVDPGNFPRETEARLEILKDASNLTRRHASAVQMVRLLLQENGKLKKEHEKQLEYIQALDVSTKEEMEEWIMLVDRFAEALEKLKLKCRYCGVPLSQESVNAFCKANNSLLSNQDIESAGSNNSKEFGGRGSALHYFVQ